MRALLCLVYAVAAYFACLAVLLWFIGFSANLVVAKTVDSGGAGASLATALGVDALLLALFGVQHSVMARRGFKQWWTRVVPEPVERSTYIVASTLAIGVLMAFWVPVATPVVWHVENAVGAGVLWAVCALGWGVVLLSTFLLDHFELFGLRQAWAAVTRQVATDGGLRTPLLYRYVRHPLYLGFLLAFWAAPVMTLGHLAFALGMSAYVAVGVTFEERDLVRAFGDRYRDYRRQVGMLLPRLRRSGSRPMR